MRELVRFAALTRSLWLGDLTRSITGSHLVTRVLELAIIGLATVWPVVSFVTVQPGGARVPPELLLRLLDDAVVGSALVSATLTCVLTVLLPVSRALETMLCAAPLSRTTRAIGPLLPLLVGATVGGPVVMSPLIAPVIRLGTPSTAVAAVLLSGTSAVAAALLTVSCIRLFRWFGSRSGLADPLAETLSAALSLAGWICITFAGRSVRLPWEGPASAALTSRASCWSVALVIGIFAAIATARLTRSQSSAVGVRVLSKGGRSFARGHPALLDVLLWVRNPLAVSTTLLMALLVGAAAIVERSGNALGEAVALPLLLGVPCAIGLVHYGTDRTTSWRRSTVLPLHRDAWSVLRVAEGFVAAAVGAAASLLFLVPRTADADAGLLSALAGLATGAGLLSGILVPSDLELPGGAVLAALAAGLLIGVPMQLLTRLLPGATAAATIALLAAVLIVASCFAVQARRKRSVLA